MTDTALVDLMKYHGVGNDFLILLDPTATIDTPGRHDLGALARRVCDRHRGIGADGLIVSRPAADGAGDTMTFHLRNADGGEAEMSGNGMRCLAHAALDAGWVDEATSFGVRTPVGSRQVTIRRTAEANVAWAAVEMGAPVVGGDADRCNVGHGQLLVDMGNPHLVVLGPDPDTVDVATLGRTLEASQPAGVNVEFVTLGPGPDEITMRVWERGVGETQACGTGACAAAVALHHWGRVGRTVTVHQPGGAVAVDWRPDGTLALSGPSERIGSCQVAVAPRRSTVP